MTALVSISWLAFVITFFVAWGLFKNIRLNFTVNSWLMGTAIFLFNAFLFSTVVFVYFNTSKLILKYAFIPVIFSIVVCFAVGECWRGSKTERLNSYNRKQFLLVVIMLCSIQKNYIKTKISRRGFIYGSNWS